MVPGLNTNVELFRLLDYHIATNSDFPEEGDIAPKHEFMDIEMSVNHDIENNPDQMILTTSVSYAAKDEHFKVSPYRILTTTSTMINWSSTDNGDVDLQTQSIIMIIEGLSAALSLTRGVVSQTTSLGVDGEFILPFVDVEKFLEQYLAEITDEDEEATVN